MVADLSINLLYIYRIHFVVGNACVKVWATKMISDFQHYLEAGEKGIEGRCVHIADAIAGMHVYIAEQTIIIL